MSPRYALGAALFVFLPMLGACGRIGLTLFPAEADLDGSWENETPGHDGGAPPEDGALPEEDDGAAQSPDDGASPSADDGAQPSPDDAAQSVDSSDSAQAECSVPCSNPNGSADCNGSSCSLSCSAGFADCDSMGGNGCETDLGVSDLHCGGCGKACQNLHGTTRCSAGACVPQCAANFADCDSNPANGCETALDTTSDCGMCGRVCTAASGGTAACQSGACATVCTLGGSYALKLSVASTWPGTALLSSGSGTFTFWGLLQLSQSGTTLTGALTECQEVAPDFRSSPLINERYGLAFPNALFDRTPTLPSGAASGALSSAAPGAQLTLARTALLVGASLPDPVQSPWPSASALTAVDADGDGKPGISVPYKTGSGYSSPPADNVGNVRAQTGYLATRFVFSLSGTLDSCTSSSGSVSAQGAEYHTLGCRTTANRDCTATEADHLDQSGPNFQGGAGSYSLIKVPDGAGCAAVRSALP